MTPLYELHHDVVIAITDFLTTLGAVVEEVDACEYVQLLVRAHDVTIHIEDVLVHRAVGHITREAGVGIRNTESCIVVNLRDGNVVGKRNTRLEEVLDIVLRSNPGRSGRVTDLATGFPLGQVVP